MAFCNHQKSFVTNSDLFCNEPSTVGPRPTCSHRDPSNPLEEEYEKERWESKSESDSDSLKREKEKNINKR